MNDNIKQLKLQVEIQLVNTAYQISTNIVH